MLILKKLFIFILIIYLIRGLLLYLKQRDILYLPSAQIDTPFETLTFKNGKVQIKVFKLNSNHDDAIIYFGGNAESVAYSAQAFAKTFPNHTLYFVNYRGYGGSSSTPTEEGLYEDALFIYDNIKKEHQHINIIGRSLGTGVATYLASQREISRMVLVTPFDSISSVAQEKFPLYPMFLLLKDKYDSIGRATKITAKKTLILMAREDTLIPNRHSEKLADAFIASHVERDYFWEKGHNDIQTAKEYYPKIKAFIENQDKKFACGYSGKATKENPYSDMLSFDNCGELKGDKLTLDPKHLANMSFKKGSESEYGLTTIFSSSGFFYVTKEGKTLKMFMWDNGADHFIEGVARYLENGKMGFANTKLEIVIKAQYDWAEWFKDGKAIVSNGCHKEQNEYGEHYSMVGGLWGAIDKKGEILVPIKYKSKTEVLSLLSRKINYTKIKK